MFGDVEFFIKNIKYYVFCNITIFYSSLVRVPIINTKTNNETGLMFQIDIVEECKANNRKAQLKLYKQYCDGMFCVAMRFLKNEVDAEDVTQESFIKAFQKIDQFKGDVTFGAWLKRIVINKSIDFLKSKRQRMVELDESFMSVTEDDDWTIESGINLEEVKIAIESLPEKYKYVVMMFLMEGFDHNEISEVLGLTSSNCRTRLLRGKGLLKELLKNKGYATGS